MIDGTKQQHLLTLLNELANDEGLEHPTEAALATQDEKIAALAANLQSAFDFVPLWD
jgi:hypothetical protein